MLRVALLVLAVLALVVPGTALADFVHVVGPGESLSSIAATDGLTVDELAAANGLPLSAQLIAGSQLRIPPQGSTAVAAAGGSSPAGSYVVVPGDTLTAIAARAGTSVAQLAADNAIDPGVLLPAGSVLRLPGSEAASTDADDASTDVATTDAGSHGGAAADGQPVGSAAEGNPSGPPYPTAETVTPDQVGAIAAADGVPPALAEAVADQESGFNNSVVSGADARGVMQILPGPGSGSSRRSRPVGPHSHRRRRSTTSAAGCCCCARCCSPPAATRRWPPRATSRGSRPCGATASIPRRSGTSTTCWRCSSASAAAEHEALSTKRSVDFARPS